MIPHKILVTGAAGYIGSVLCPRLVQAGHEVIAVDLPARESPLKNPDPAFRFVPGDVRDPKLIEALIAEADAVIWLAALVGASACEKQSREAWEINFESVKLIRKFKKPGQAVIFPMTNSGYRPAPSESFVTESTTMTSDTIYGQSKLAAEKELLEIPNVVSLRLASLFGASPAMRWDLLFHHMIREAATRHRLEIYEADAKRNFVHVKDVVECFLFAIENAGRMNGCYNLAQDSANVTKRDLALILQKKFPELAIEFHDREKDPDGRDFFVSSEKLKQAGFKARHGLEDGVDEIMSLLKREEIPA